VSSEGRSVVASPEELRTWLGNKSGHQFNPILTNESDLSTLLKHGLRDARASRKADTAKRPLSHHRRERKLPAPKPEPTRYSPALPLSQMESRVAGLQKRIAQLEEIMKSIPPSYKRTITSEIKSLRSAIAHYIAGLQIERELSGNAE